MCVLSNCPQDEGRRRNPRRSRLADIPSSFHCSIVGTCIALAELMKLAAKAGLSIPSDLSNYQVHVVFVQAAGRAGGLERLMSKALDRKHHIAIEKTRALTTPAELRAFWSSAMKAGNVAGPYWALMSHGQANDELRSQMFGDVHMLSHLVGSANRADLQRLEALSVENRQIGDKLAEQRARAAGLAEDLRKRICELEQQLAEANIRNRLATIATTDPMQAPRADLSSRVRGLQEDIARRDARIAGLEERLAEAEKRMERALEERDTLEDLLERRLTLPVDRDPVERDDDPASSLFLAGASIVYVGGRPAQVGRLRDLVEKAGGRFLHHDGGVEDGFERLEGALAKGDAVFCPIDCVSHGACQRAKTFCKRTGKSFLPLRASSLSAFASGLREISVGLPAAGTGS